MPSPRLCLALSTSLLGLAILACTNDNDPLGINMDTGGDEPTGTTGTEPTDGSGGDEESGGGSENCEMPDPECTTNAACGNDELCIECVCVDVPEGCDNDGNCVEDSDCGPNETCENCVCDHPCMSSKEGCTTDADCEPDACDPKTCSCESPPSCGPIDECEDDTGCPPTETCNLDTCLCEPAMCECQAGGPLCDAGQYCDGCNCQAVPGISDPAEDCDADGTPIACTPSTDLLGTDVTCNAGTITVTAYFEQPVEPTPSTAMRRIVEFLDPLGYLVLRLWASAPGDGAGPYECSVIVPGVMMSDIGPDDVCEINPDGSFQFALSAESEALALSPISDLFARSENSDPYHYDDGDPIPNPCQ